jgi:hypothetical protein
VAGPADGALACLGPSLRHLDLLCLHTCARWGHGHSFVVFPNPRLCRYPSGVVGYWIGWVDGLATESQRILPEDSTDEWQGVAPAWSWRRRPLEPLPSLHRHVSRWDYPVSATTRHRRHCQLFVRFGNSWSPSYLPRYLPIQRVLSRDRV